VEHQFRQIRIETSGIRQVMLQLEQREPAALREQPVFEGIVGISWGFDFAPYFSAAPDVRSAMLTDVCEASLGALASKHRWDQRAFAKVFAGVRKAGYRLDVDLAKVCRSPDRRKNARVGYSVDREQFEIWVEVTAPKRQVLLQQTVHHARPTAAMCARPAFGRPFWKSDRQLVIPFDSVQVRNRKLVVKIPQH
jgi:hypothetical protein